MGNNRTAEESKQQYVSKMGAELGELYSVLWQEVAWLYAKWAEYTELFGKKPERIALLNQAAPHFFRIVQDSLWEETILHIARLTDPPKSAGKANLTIQRLVGLTAQVEVHQKVSALVEEAIAASAFCRDWRNRHIAHIDLQLALKKGIEPLAAASREKVRLAITSISNVLNAVSLHYLESTTFFDVPSGNGGVLALIHVLDDGLKARKSRDERLRRGEYLDEDYRSRNL